MTFPELEPLSLRLVIMSRGRAHAITSHRLFPAATLVVPDSEAEAYAHTGLEIISIPDEIKGISAVRNGIIRRFPERALVMLDDDISACVCMSALKSHRLTPEQTAAIIENTACCAAGAGARLFGWNQRSDPRQLQRNDPFGVQKWVGGAVGIVRDEKGNAPEWDEMLRCKCDHDATLTELLKTRLVWQDARFSFVQKRDKNAGGNSLFRNSERIAAEKRYLKGKWKAHIIFETYKSQERTALKLARRQHVDLPA